MAAAAAGGAIEQPKAFTQVVRAAAIGAEAPLVALLGVHGDKSLVAKDEYGCDALTWAARNGRANVVTNVILKKDADIESKSFGGFRPLHHACNNNEEAIVMELVKKGADVNAKDDAGNSPLHLAAKRGMLSLVQFLVEHKGDPSAKNANGSTPLHMAVNSGQSSIASYLLSKEADPNEADKGGNTALHFAARCGFPAICKLLIAGGAKASANRAGKTPADVAADHDTAKVAATASE